MRIDLSEKSVSWAFPKIQKYNHRKVGEYMHEAYPENFFSFVIDAGARGIVHPKCLCPGAATIVAVKKEIIDEDPSLYVSNIWSSING